MRHTVTIDLDDRLSTAAANRAAENNLSLPVYIELLLQKEIGGTDSIPLIVFAPENVREIELIRGKGETEEEFERSKNIINAILDVSGH